MKLLELAKKVVSYLKNQNLPVSTGEIIEKLKIPAKKKRRVYDVLDVLKAIEAIEVAKIKNENIIKWKKENSNSLETLDERANSIPYIERELCVVNLDVIFPANDYKMLKWENCQEMLKRDIKRNVPGVLDVIVNEINLNVKKDISEPLNILL
ncbi:MAG: hypothetical protein ACTSSJ_02265 [Candidatus Odinarchaeia archaeon]